MVTVKEAERVDLPRVARSAYRWVGPASLEGKETVGVTAVASIPDHSTDEAVVRLEKLANQLEAEGRGRRRRLQPSRVGAGEGG